MLLCMGNGGRYGVRYALWGMAGIIAGNLVLILLSSLGLGLLLERSERIFIIIQWLGAAYLIWLGVRLCLQPIVTEPELNAADRLSPSKLFIQSLGVALSNPKGLIYFSALFPQFLSPERALLPQLLLLIGLFMSIDFIWMLIYAKGGSTITRWLHSPHHRRIFQYCSGGALMVAGVLLLLVKI